MKFLRMTIKIMILPEKFLNFYCTLLFQPEMIYLNLMIKLKKKKIHKSIVVNYLENLRVENNSLALRR